MLSLHNNCLHNAHARHWGQQLGAINDDLRWDVQGEML